MQINEKNSILYYSCAESTATRPITDTAHVDTNNYIMEQYNIKSKDKLQANSGEKTH
jgi:hypothetical protein